MTTTPTIEQMADAVEEDAATVSVLMPMDASKAERAHRTSLQATAAFLRSMHDPSDEVLDAAVAAYQAS